VPDIKRIIKYLTVLLLLSGAGFAAYKMCSMALEYNAGRSTYEQVQNLAVSQITSPPPGQKPELLEESSPPPGTEQNAVSAPEFPTIDFSLLEERNSDTVGWVFIDGTNINYPVVQGEDNRHYVSTLFDGSENQAGSIFMDYRNNADMNDTHTILYGHNMRNKTMFADILNYQSQEYYDTHPYGLYITKEKNYSFEIVAAYVASLADPAWQLEFATEEDSLRWLNESVDKSAFQSKVQATAGDRFITLSTCSYEFDDARFVLIGILKEY